MKCEDCKFWNRVSTVHDVGTCQRYAPFDAGRERDAAGGFSHFFGTNRDWPQTAKSDWCGEFVSRKRWWKP